MNGAAIARVFALARELVDQLDATDPNGIEQRLLQAITDVELSIPLPERLAAAIFRRLEAQWKLPSPLSETLYIFVNRNGEIVVHVTGQVTSSWAPVRELDKVIDGVPVWVVRQDLE